MDNVRSFYRMLSVSTMSNIQYKFNQGALNVYNLFIVTYLLLINLSNILLLLTTSLAIYNSHVCVFNNLKKLNHVY